MRSGRRRLTTSIAIVVAAAVTAGAAAWAVVSLSSRIADLTAVVLSAGLGRKVEVARVHGGLRSGLVLEDVVLADLPGSSSPLLVARRITLRADLLRLAREALSRRGVGGGIERVILEDPVLTLSRDPAGVWNVTSLLSRTAGPQAAGAFRGSVVVKGGVVRFSDHRRLAPDSFEAHLLGLSGSADFGTAGRIEFQGAAVEERGGAREPVEVRGAYHLPTRILDLDLAVMGSDAAAWGHYLFNTPRFVISAGRFDAAIHILTIRRAGRSTTDVFGLIKVRGGRASVPAQRIVVDGVTGDLRVLGRRLRSQGLTGRLNGSPLEVAGEVVLAREPSGDIVARSKGVDLRMLARLLFPSAAHRLAGVASGDVRIVGSLRSPEIEGRLATARGRIDGYGFEGIAAEFSLLGGAFSLDRFSGQLEGATLSGSAWGSLAAGHQFLTLRFDDADAATVAAASGASLPRVAGRLDGAVALLRTPSGLSVTGMVVASDARLAGEAFDTATATFTSSRSGLLLHDLRLRRGAAWAVAAGRLTGPGGLGLRVEAGEIDLAALPLPAGFGAPTGRVGFSGTVSGSIADPALAGEVHLFGGRLGDLPIDSARSSLRAGRSGLVLESAALRQGFSRFQISGTIPLRPSSRLALDVSLDRGSVSTLGRLLGLPEALSGTVEGRVAVGGTPARPTASGSLTVRDGAAFGQPIERAEAVFRWDGAVLAVDDSNLRTGGSLLGVAGTYDRRAGLRLSLSGSSIHLRDIAVVGGSPVGLEGRVEITGRITGRPESPSIALSAVSPDLVVNGRRFDEASVQARFEARTLRLEPLSLRAGDERYRLAGEISLAASHPINLSLTAEEGRISTLLAVGNIRPGVPVEGRISGELSAVGPIANPSARIDLRMDSGRLGDYPLLGGRVNLALREGTVSIESFEILPATGRVAATGRLNLRGESQIEVGGSDLDMDLLRSAMRLRRPLVGRLNFTTQMGGTLAAPEIGFALDVTKGGIAGATFDALIANAFYKDGLLQIQHALLVQDGHKLRAVGSLPFNPALLRFDERRPIDLRLTLADVNLGLLRLASDQIVEGRGAVEGALLIDGTVASPHLTGGIRIQDGLLRLRGVQTPIESLRLDVRFEDSTIRVAEGSARMGAGTVRLEGAARVVAHPTSGLALSISDEAPLSLRATSARVVVPPMIDLHATGTLKLRGSLADGRRPVTVEGHLLLADGAVIVSPGTGASPAASSRLAFRGLSLEAGSNLSARVGGFKLDIRPGGAVELVGTLRSPTLEGSIAAQQGTIVALGTSFDLREGTAVFSPHMGIYPTVAATAETRVGATQVFLTVRGTPPDALTLDLRSDPDLPRAEIVGLLGRQASITRLLGGDVAGAIGTELGRILFGQISLALGKAIGLSEFVVEYDFKGPLALRLGKALFPELYLTLTTTFEEKTRYLWALEYRFARQWQFSLRIDSAGFREAVLWYTARF